MPTDVPVVPIDRPGGVGSPPDVGRIAALGAVGRVRLPTGRPAFLITGHDAVRAALVDPRFRAPGSDPVVADEYGVSPLFRMAGNLMALDGPDHRRLRTALSPAFAMRRMEDLRPRIREIVHALLDDLERCGPPADLHERLSLPLPTRVLCHLLGVHPDDHAEFTAWSDALLVAPDGDFTGAADAWQAMGDHLRRLIRARRTHPADDLLSTLAHSGVVSDDEAVGLAVATLVGGIETTVVTIEYGLVALHRHPEQLAALRADPGLAPQAVEELLRLFPPRAVSAGLMRFAAEDVEAGGTLIPAGSCVLMSAEAASVDPDRFPRPGEFDITRSPNPHLAFGHGPHHCIGAALARFELQELFAVLFTRLPHLRPAVPPEALRVRTHLLNGGFETLPVTW